MLLAARPTLVAHGAHANSSSASSSSSSPLTTSTTVTVTVPSSSSSTPTPLTSQHHARPAIAPLALVSHRRKGSGQRVQHPEDAREKSDGVVLGGGATLLENALVSHLSYLASQHHLSEYTKLKFGPAGCPAPYVPMSLQLRDHVRHLQARQAIYSRQKAWWPSDDGCVQKQAPSPSANATTAANASAPSFPSPSSAMSLSLSLSQPLMALQRVDVEIPPHQMPSMVTPQAVDNLQKELSAAMASEIQPSSSSSAAFVMQQEQQQRFHVTKTSETHPINISMVIPFEFLPTLQSQLSVAPKTSPCMFHLPRKYHMDLATLIPIPGAYSCASAYQFVGSPSAVRVQRPPQPVLQVQNGVVGFGRIHPFHPPPPVAWSQQQPSGEELLKMALDDGDEAKDIVPSDNNARDDPHSLSSTPPPPFLVPSQQNVAPLVRVMTESPPVAVTPILTESHLPVSSTVEKEPLIGVIRRPRHVRATSAPPSFGFSQGQTLREAGRAVQRNKSHLDVPSIGDTPAERAPRPHTAGSSSSKPPSAYIAGSQTTPADKPSYASATSFQTSLTENPAHLKASASSQANHFIPSNVPNGNLAPLQPIAPLNHLAPSAPAVSKLGNLFLSSCPGKKVRLTGPVKGRGAVCRDLAQDLARIRALGVRCIICCLDDAELQYLGSPWPQYRARARELGLDVLRLPTPEGLHPLSAAQLDRELGRVIGEYTLRGAPVLAHCRGGVGRAGLVACCWLLKLGLCGWKEEGVCRCWRCVKRGGEMPVVTTTTTTMTTLMPVCYATVHLLEKVIGVVRRRRSLKAIETFEQVKFLVDFIEYLDAKRHMAAASAES